GIRDFHVTGVQTCALPICAGIHPNDDVNLGQSSNDVIPTALRVSAQLAVVEDLQPALGHLRRTIERRARGLGKVTKTGRTHLMEIGRASCRERVESSGGGA